MYIPGKFSASLTPPTTTTHAPARIAIPLANATGAQGYTTAGLTPSRRIGEFELVDKSYRLDRSRTITKLQPGE